jgi:hypothetical protein
MKSGAAIIAQMPIWTFDWSTLRPEFPIKSFFEKLKIINN